MAIRDTSYKIIFLFLVFLRLVEEMLHLDLVPQEPSQPCESLQELSAFGRLVSHELDVAAEVLVVHCQPLGQTPRFVLLLHDLQHCAGVLVLVELGVAGLAGPHEEAGNSLRLGILDLDSYVVEVLEADDLAHCTGFDQLHRVLDTVNDHSVTNGDVVEETGNQGFFLHELDVGQSLCGLLNGLVESILESIGDINDIDDLDLQSGIEHFGLVEIVFEVSASGQDQTSDVAPVVSDEGLGCDLAHLPQVVVPLLFPETGETDGGLTALVMLLRQFDRELIEDFSRVALESGVKGAITVNDDESEGRLIDEEFLLELIEVELGVAVIDGEVDWLEGLKVTDELPFRCRVFVHDLAGKDDQAVVRSALVKFESFPG